MRRLRWFLAVAPDPRMRDPDRVLELTARMIELESVVEYSRRWDPSLSPHWILRGIALHCKGEFASAIIELEPPLQARRKDRTPTYWSSDVLLVSFVLAMAYHKTGDRVRALDYYRTAAREMDITRPRDAELMVVRAESAALLGVTEHPNSTGRKEDDTPQHSQQ